VGPFWVDIYTSASGKREESRYLDKYSFEKKKGFLNQNKVFEEVMEGSIQNNEKNLLIRFTFTYIDIIAFTL